MDESETIDLQGSLKNLAMSMTSWDPRSSSLEVDGESHPLVNILAQLINALNQQWRQEVAQAEVDEKRRTVDLSKAYEAIQAKNDEMQRDLETARRIQHQLLPQGPEIPLRPELLFHGFYQSVEKVGGDLYDIIRVGKNAYALLVADVSGHGLPSALITMLVKAAFRTRSRWGVATDAVCREVNAVLHPIVSDLGFFVTAFFAVLDLETGILRYTNCGHNPAVLARPSKGTLEILDTQGIILGPMEEIQLEEGFMTLEPRDLLVVYTDGITEARNFLDDEYGVQRLTHLVQKLSSQGRDGDLTKAVVEGVKKDLRSFCMGASQQDDQTLAAFQFLDRAAVPVLDVDLDAASARKVRSVGTGLNRAARAAFKGHRWEEAENLLRGLVTLEPDHLSGRLLLAMTLAHRGRKDEARSWASTVMSMAPEESALGQKARNLARRLHKG